MSNPTPSWEQIESTFRELIQDQQSKLLKCALRINPSVTEEDLLQPNDYLELELNPHFRFEEGLLIGLQSAQMAFQALQKENFLS